jgi:fructose/tagatose bisphosphate aldolase
MGGADRGGLATLLAEATSAGSAVMAFNVVDPASMLGVLDAAERCGCAVVVQLSVRAVRQWGVAAALGTFAEARTRRGVRAVLHLDHCGEPDLAEACLSAGWDSVLFDASGFPFPEAVRATRGLVEFAGRLGGDVEGEFEAIPRLGTDGLVRPARAGGADRAVEFIRATGVTCFSPDLGTAHGSYRGQPEVDLGRARAISAATGTPLVLHGGTGLDPATIAGTVDCGVRKVNVSTQVKSAYLDAAARVQGAAGEPLELLQEVRSAVRDVAAGYFHLLDRHRERADGPAATAVRA